MSCQAHHRSQRSGVCVARGAPRHRAAPAAGDPVHAHHGQGRHETRPQVRQGVPPARLPLLLRLALPNAGGLIDREAAELAGPGLLMDNVLYAGHRGRCACADGSDVAGSTVI